MANYLNREKELRFYRYYYVFHTYIYDLDNNEQYNIDDQVLLIRLFQDYSLIFPVLTLKISIDSDTNKLIRDNNVYIRINATKKLLSDTSESNDNSLIEEEIFLDNELFEIIDKNKIMYTDNDFNSDIPSLETMFTLFSVSHLKANKKLFNGNFLNCRVIDIMSFIQSVNGSTILIEKPINMTKYEQILVPGMNSFKLMKYLQDHYFIYENGLRMFFNYNEGIIMNSTLSKSTPQNANDYRNVIFDIIIDDEINQISPYNVGYKSDSGNYYYIKTSDTNIKISDNTRAKQEILGSKRTLISKDEYLNNSIVDWELGEEEKVIDKQQLYYDKYNNPYRLDDWGTTSTAISAVFNFTNLDVDTFKPNKLFLCSLHNRDYEFQVSKVGFLFTKDKENNVYICTGSCFFKKN